MTGKGTSQSLGEGTERRRDGDSIRQGRGQGLRGSRDDSWVNCKAQAVLERGGKKCRDR